MQPVGGGLGGQAAPVSDERAHCRWLVHKMRYTNRRLIFTLPLCLVAVTVVFYNISVICLAK